MPTSYIGSSSYEYHNMKPYDDFSITLYAYRCKLINGNLTLSEHTDSRWVVKDEMLKRIPSISEEVSRKSVRGTKWLVIIDKNI